MNKYFLIARKRGFWTTDLSKLLFGYRLILPPRSPRIVQTLFFLSGLIMILILRPKLIFFGTSTSLALWFSFLKRKGFFKNIVFITDKQYLKTSEVDGFDKVLVYSPNEINQYPEHQKRKFVFVLYPSKAELTSSHEDVHKKNLNRYVFCGGSNMRDHASFIGAMKNIEGKAVIVTDKQLPKNIPENCKVYGRLPLEEYMELMRNSEFVVVPLLPSNLPHGHCDISGAIRLGKPVITTRNAGVDSYVRENENGILVNPFDVEGYESAIRSLFNDDILLKRLTTSAQKSSKEFSYEKFYEKIKNICEETIKISNKDI